MAILTGVMRYLIVIWFYCFAYFIDYAVTVFPNLPLYPPSTMQPQPSSLPFSSSPWVVCISSLTFLFPIPFLPSPHLFDAYQLGFLFLVPSPTHSSSPLTYWNPSMWCPFLWFCSCSGYLLSFCFSCFSFLLGSFVYSCEFVVILLFIFFIFFFLGKSL